MLHLSLSELSNRSFEDILEDASVKQTDLKAYTIITEDDVNYYLFGGPFKKYLQKTYGTSFFNGEFTQRGSEALEDLISVLWDKMCGKKPNPWYNENREWVPGRPLYIRTRGDRSGLGSVKSRLVDTSYMLKSGYNPDNPFDGYYYIASKKSYSELDYYRGAGSGLDSSPRVNKLSYLNMLARSTNIDNLRVSKSARDYDDRKTNRVSKKASALDYSKPLDKSLGDDDNRTVGDTVKSKDDVWDEFITSAHSKTNSGEALADILSKSSYQEFISEVEDSGVVKAWMNACFEYLSDILVGSAPNAVIGWSIADKGTSPDNERDLTYATLLGLLCQGGVDILDRLGPDSDIGVYYNRTKRYQNLNDGKGQLTSSSYLRRKVGNAKSPSPDTLWTLMLEILQDLI